MSQLKSQMRSKFPSKYSEKVDTTTTQTIRLDKTGLKYAILCDASYHPSSFALMIEDYFKNSRRKTVKTYARVSFGS